LRLGRPRNATAAAHARCAARPSGAFGGPRSRAAFEYDSAERLTQVNDLGSGGARRILKKYTFSDVNDASRGKLLTARRVNHPLGITGDVDVTESYFYLGPAGAASRKDTEVKVSGAVFQTFTQSYGYDDLGAAKTLDYPRCATATPCTVSGGGVGTLSRAFTNGRLTGVGSYASAISYHPNGTINQLTHPGSVIVTDTHEQDPNGMARPRVIRFNGYTTTTCPASVTITPEVTTMCVNASKNASVTAVSGAASYSWTIQNGTITSAANLQTITFTSATAGTVILQATVSVAGCTPVSAPQASVAVTASASITSGQPADPAPIAPHATAQLTVSASGSNLQYQWYQGEAPNGSPINGATSATFNTLALTLTTKYWVQVTSTCGTANSRTATVTVVIPAPSSMAATTQSNGTTVRITWSGVSDASSYLVEWAENVSGPWSPAGTTPALLLDHNPGAGANVKAYVYRVHSVDAATNPSPEVTRTDYAVTATALFSDERIQKNVTLVRAAHIVELRKAIDALRAAVNLPPVWQSASPPSGLISATPTNELLAPFNAARTLPVFGLGALAYSGGIPAPATGIRILSEHIQEVRDALR